MFTLFRGAVAFVPAEVVFMFPQQPLPLLSMHLSLLVGVFVTVFIFVNHFFCL